MMYIIKKKNFIQILNRINSLQIDVRYELGVSQSFIYLE